MAINGINIDFKSIKEIKAPSETQPKGPAKGEGSNFGDMLENALKEVNDLQTEADSQIEGLTLKKDGFTPHTAMVALEKADIAFQLMSAIRGKIIRAYEEVIRTQV
jgi:flagellar hook-basal body complex protein FliE